MIPIPIHDGLMSRYSRAGGYPIGILYSPLLFARFLDSRFRSNDRGE